MEVSSTFVLFLVNAGVGLSAIQKWSQVRSSRRKLKFFFWTITYDINPLKNEKQVHYISVE